MNTEVVNQEAPIRAEPNDSEYSQFAHYSAPSIAGLEMRISQGIFVSGEEVAEILRHRETDQFPASVIEYIAAIVAGEIKKPRGRPRDNYAVYVVKTIFLPLYYQRLLKFVQRRKAVWEKAQRANPKHRRTERDMDYGWSFLHGKDYWVGEPHERAARLTAQYWLGDHNKYKTVLNAVSSQK